MSFFSLVKFYFFVGTVGTAGTWRPDAIAVGTFFGILGTCSHVFFGNKISEKIGGNMGTSRSDAIYKMFPLFFSGNTQKKMFPLFFAGTWEHSFFSEFIFIEI